jgi:hypothetical protein
MEGQSAARGGILRHVTQVMIPSTHSTSKSICGVPFLVIDLFLVSCLSDGEVLFQSFLELHSGNLILTRDVSFTV